MEPQIFHPNVMQKNKNEMKHIYIHYDRLGPSILSKTVYSIRGMQANVLRFFHFVRLFTQALVKI